MSNAKSQAVYYSLAFVLLLFTWHNSGEHIVQLFDKAGDRFAVGDIIYHFFHTGESISVFHYVHIFNGSVGFLYHLSHFFFQRFGGIGTGSFGNRYRYIRHFVADNDTGIFDCVDVIYYGIGNFFSTLMQRIAAGGKNDLK